MNLGNSRNKKFEVDISWEEGRLVEATIRSLRGERCRVKSFTTTGKLEVRRRGRRHKSVCKGDVTEFLTKSGESYIVRNISKGAEGI